jgi:hypothetical protein
MTDALAHAARTEPTTTESSTAESNASRSGKAGSRERLPTAIGVRVLLVSRDIQTIDTLCEFMGKIAMHVEVCSDFASATRKLCHAKFEALVVDFKDRAEALEFLKTSRQMTSHKASVVLQS